MVEAEILNTEHKSREHQLTVSTSTMSDLLSV